MAALEVLPEPQQSLCQTTLSMCAYAATGDVLVVQQMLHICSKHYDTDVIACSYYIFRILYHEEKKETLIGSLRSPPVYQELFLIFRSG